jgi:predicted nicotinamide N-methyase
MSADVILSELLIGLPPGAGSTRFHYRPDSSGSSDSDSGSERSSDSSDAVRRRPPKRRARAHFVTIRHAGATPVARCGAQVWRGACLLADAALDTAADAGSWRALELGAGAGLLAALSAARRRCPLFIATDAEPSALALAATNLAAARGGGSSSSGTSRQPAGTGRGSVGGGGGGSRELVRHLSWFCFLGVDPEQLTDSELLTLLNGGMVSCCDIPNAAASAAAGAGSGTAAASGATAAGKQADGGQAGGDPTASEGAAAAAAAAAATAAVEPQYAWAPQDLDLLATVDVVLAGDCVYDPPLTEALVHAAACLLRWIQRKRRGALPRGHQIQEPQPPEAGSQQPLPPDSQQPGAQLPPPRLLLASEKRYNFTWHDAERPRAAAWEHFLSFVEAEGSSSEDGDGREAGGSGSSDTGGSHTGTAGGVRQHVRQRKLLRGRRLGLPKQVSTVTTRVASCFDV